ncbi:MAG: hypothetical protein AAGA20_17510 [Planctomycetota bacterium]
MISNATILASALTPLDWGITAGAVLILIYAARTFVTGKGKSQMGASFAFMASLVWTLAIGRHLDGFTFLHGLQVAFGVLLLVPVLRVLFTHTGGSITFAVISLILASAIAGPVIARFAGQITDPDRPRVEEVRVALDEVERDIEAKTKTRDQVAGFAGAERESLRESGHDSAEDIEADPAALAALERYAGYKDQLDNLMAEIAELMERKEELSMSLAVLESENGASGAEAERIRRLVEAEVERDRPMVERYARRGEMLELFEEEFGVEEN